jgi:DNA-directed RNA polymerase subunit K/omega
MIHRPPDSNAFEFVRVAALRAAQLMRGCSPRVPAGLRPVVTAQLEVVAGNVQAEYRLEESLHAVAFVRSEVEPVRTPTGTNVRGASPLRSVNGSRG